MFNRGEDAANTVTVAHAIRGEIMVIRGGRLSRRVTRGARVIGARRFVLEGRRLMRRCGVRLMWHCMRRCPEEQSHQDENHY